MSTGRRRPWNSSAPWAWHRRPTEAVHDAEPLALEDGAALPHRPVAGEELLAPDRVEVAQRALILDAVQVGVIGHRRRDHEPPERQHGFRAVDGEALAHPVVPGPAGRGGDADAHRGRGALAATPHLEEPPVLLEAEAGQVIDRNRVILASYVRVALMAEVQGRSGREAPAPGATVPRHAS